MKVKLRGQYSIDASNVKEASFYPLGEDFRGEGPKGELSFNNYYLEKNGRPFFGISGELHYSRMDPARWEDELIKMRMAGINTVSTYVIWNHVEEEEGVFDFSGRRDLRRFIQLAEKHGLYVILRVGPYISTCWGGSPIPQWALPVFNGYAYRPWIFYSGEACEHYATDCYIYVDYHRSGSWVRDGFTPPYVPETRPYSCCEMGAGMMCSYHYRFIYPYKSVDALANIKLASGCNFLGYYIFHGGTNPVGKTGVYMNESQMPKISYDYQAAIGEFGQVRESCRRLKSLHFFVSQFADRPSTFSLCLTV